MASDITAGRLLPDKDRTGGIKTVYFANYTSGLEGTATFDSNDQITAFASLIALYQYDINGNNSNFDETDETNKDNGTTFTSQTGTVVLRKQDIASRKELKLMTRDRKLVFVKDRNDDVKVYGLENGCDISFTASSGSGFGDLTGYTLTINAEEPVPAFFVDSSIIGDSTNTSVTVGT